METVVTVWVWMPAFCLYHSITTPSCDSPSIWCKSTSDEVLLDLMSVSMQSSRQPVLVTTFNKWTDIPNATGMIHLRVGAGGKGSRLWLGGERGVGFTRGHRSRIGIEKLGRKKEKMETYTVVGGGTRKDDSGIGSRIGCARWNAFFGFGRCRCGLAAYRIRDEVGSFWIDCQTGDGVFVTF